eukprot:TRINITY_DN15746_c0_g1_i1.p1 TRINITY_DN15746_c0_g1~~TRINITY_DN15746_c0_g1_i1.p1  ORF type:complete len:613 (+),score=100.45 TRINITY_DN15746_c0_g1_i1:42-1880(+)
MAPQTPFPQRLSIDEVLAKCRNDDVKFVDGDFPPSSLLLHNAPADTEWVRSDELCKQPSFIGKQSSILIQGQLSDCWFLGPLTALSKNRTLLDRVIGEATQYKEHGIYKFRFFRQGSWQEVYVDDLIPCQNGVPLYVRGKDENEIWSMLCEKAYAKFCGGYTALHRGTESTALAELTGAPTQYIYLCNDQAEARVSDELFAKLAQHFKEKDLMTITAVERRRPSSNTINAFHSYTILDIRTEGSDRLMLLRNPWGESEWQGKWSRSAENWPKPLADKLKPSAQPAGNFWIEWDDVCANFDYVCLARTLPAANVSVTQSRWERMTAGGWYMTQSFFENPQFACSVTAPGTVYVMLEAEETSRYVGLWSIKMQDGLGKLKLAENVDQVYAVVAESDISNRRQVGLEFAAVPGVQYCIIPCQLNKFDIGAFTLTVTTTAGTVHVHELSAGSLSAVSGEFSLRTAGGTPQFPSWPLNPQVKLTVPTRMQVTLAMQQSLEYTPIDMNAIIDGDSSTLVPVDFDDMVHVGFCVFRSNSSGMHLSGRIVQFFKKEVVCAPPDWLHSYGLKAGATSVATILDPGEYVVVLNTGSKKERCAFRLRAFSEAPGAKLEHIEDM